MKLLKVILCIACFAVTHARAGEILTLENHALKRSWSITNGTLKTVEINNKLAGIKSSLGRNEEFMLRISDGPDVGSKTRYLSAADFKVVRAERGREGKVETISVQLEGHDIKLSLNMSLAQGDFYMRKQIKITPSKAMMLERIDVDALTVQGVRQAYTISEITADAPSHWKPGLGQPLYGDKDASFWGIEFPAATNLARDGKLRVGYLQGRMINAGETYTSYRSVMGVSDKVHYLQDAFYDYIDRTRVRPFRLQVQYNSWFDFGPNVNQESFAKSVEIIHKELTLSRRVKPLDAYVIDDGWQDTHTSWANQVWPVNKKFDADFASTLKTMKEAKSSLGLWLSPATNFGAKRPSLMKAEGYEVLGNLVSMAGPKYMNALEQRMQELTRGGVTFFKLDSLFGDLNKRAFELKGASYGLPEMPELGAGNFTPTDKRLNSSQYDDLKTYYLVAGTERLIRNFDSLAKINPNVYIVISNGAYLSPWWLQSVDSVWMINADDAAGGSSRTDELVYRDALLYELATKDQTQFPFNAIFNHEPKKINSNEDKDVFKNYLYMAMSRGTGLLELYLKPANLKSSDWDVLAEGLKWVEHVSPAFKRSRMHGGDPAKREVYGFTGWTREQGYISLHNPSNKAQNYRMTLNRAFGLQPNPQARFMMSSPLTNGMKGLKKEHRFGSTMEIKLEPGEIRVLNFKLRAS